MFSYAEQWHKLLARHCGPWLLKGPKGHVAIEVHVVRAGLPAVTFGLVFDEQDVCGHWWGRRGHATVRFELDEARLVGLSTGEQSGSALVMSDAILISGDLEALLALRSAVLGPKSRALLEDLANSLAVERN